MDSSTKNKTTRQRLAIGATAAALLGMATAGISGCGTESPQTTAAHKIADELPSIFGPAKKYDVSVDAGTFSLVRGHAHDVQIDGKDVQLAPGLVMNEMHVDARDMVINLSTHQVEKCGPVHFECALGQLRLDDYLASTKPAVNGMGVRIEWDYLEATVPVSAVGVGATVRIDGVLAPSQFGPDKLDFVPSQTHIGPVPVPQRLVDLAMERINPVIDLSTMKFPVAVTSANVVKGRLYVDGATSLGSTN